MDSVAALKTLLMIYACRFVSSKALDSSDSYSAQASEYKASYETYESPPHPFHFGYDVLDEHGNKQQRQELGDQNGHVKGSYGYTDAHGVYRHVDYVADHSGFRAIVQTNEPGVSNEDPADVKLTAKPPPQHVLEQQYSKVEAGYSEPKLYLKSVPKPVYRESSYASGSSLVPVIISPYRGALIDKSKENIVM